MILKNKRSPFLEYYLQVLLIFITITLTFCSHTTEKDVEKEEKQQHLNMLIDSINNGNVYRDPIKILNQLPKTYSLANELSDSSAICKINLTKASCYNLLGHPDSSFLYAQKALKIASYLKNDTLLAKAYNSLGIFYSNIKDYIHATDFQMKALRLMEQLGNKRGIAPIKNNLGVIFHETGDLDRSVKYYTEALQIFDSTNNKLKAALVCLNLNSVYLEKKDSINTIKYYAKALTALEKDKDTLLLCGLLGNKSLFYKSIGEIDSAIQTLNLVLDYSMAINNKPYYCITLSNLGSIYYSYLNDLEKARYFIEKSLDISREISDKEIEMDAYNILSDIENKEGNCKKEIAFFKKYIALRDSIKGGNIKKEIMAIEMQNNLEKQELEAILLKQKLDIQKKQNTILIISLTAFLLLVLVTVFVVRVSYNNLKKSNALKELEKQRLEEQMENDKKISELEKIKHDTELEAKNKELISYSLKLVTKNDLLGEISKLSDNYYNSKTLNREYFNELTNIIDRNLNIDKEWNGFKTLFENVHHGFFDRLKQKHPELTEHELRFCAYVKINLRPKEIARILNVSPNTIKSFRYRLKKRLNLSPDLGIDDFVRNI